MSKKWKIFYKTLGFIFIVVGVSLYWTPVPGTTILIILGLEWFIGKSKTLSFFKENLNKKVFRYLRLGAIIKKM